MLVQILKKRSIYYILNRSIEIFRLKIIGKISTLWFILCFRIVGGKLGKNLSIYGHVILRSLGGNISIGDNVIIVSSSWRSTSSALNHPARLCSLSLDAEIIIGNGCSLSGTSITCRSSKIRLGKGVMIAPNVTIVDSNFHQPWPPEERTQFDGKQDDAPINICSNVWIGMNSMILKGVTIGENSVVAAGSIVINSIPSNCLAAGNPAKVIKKYDNT